RDDAPPELPSEQADDGEDAGLQPVRYSDLLERWARTSEDNARLAAVSKHGAPYLAVEPRELDANPFSLNVLNGTLHFGRRRDGTARVDFRPHDPNDKITKLAPVVY